jgi:uncharacterized delta-60 repeat protein
LSPRANYWFLRRNFLLTLTHLFVGVSQAVETADGTALELDPGFKFERSALAGITALELGADGQIAFGSTKMNSSAGWLNRNGAISPPLTSIADGIAVNTLLLDREGALLVGGAHTNHALVRLPAVGSDTYFFRRAQMSGTIRQILSVAPEDIIVAGSITLPLETIPNGLVRLTRTGILRTNFNLLSSAGISVEIAIIATNDQVLASFTRTNANGELSWNFGRWFSGGETDANYDSSWLPEGAHVSALKLAPNRSILAAVEKGSRTTFIYLGPDGQPQEAAPEIPPIEGKIHALEFELGVQEPGILIGGEFTAFAGVPCNNFVWVSADGTLLRGFSPGQGPNGAIRAIRMQPDGAVLLGGDFVSFDGINATGLVRLRGRGAENLTYIYWAESNARAFQKLESGTLALRRNGDTNLALTLNLTASNATTLTFPSSVTFEPGEAEKSIEVRINKGTVAENRGSVTLHLEADLNTQIVISRPDCNLVILADEASGAIDPLYHPRLHRRPTAVAHQPDGKTLAAYWDNGPVLLRLNRDGSLDPDFMTNGVPATNLCCATISQIEVTPDAKIYVSGTFVTAASIFGTNQLVQLNPDGSLDTNFNPRIRPGLMPAQPLMFRVQPDGNILVAQLWADKKFRVAARSDNNQPLRLRPDGNLDSTFAVSAQLNLHDLLVHPDGSVFAAGRSFSETDGDRIYRFSSIGRQDTNFLVQADGPIYQLKLQPDGNLVIAGDFRSVNGIPAALARIYLSDGSVEPSPLSEIDGSVESLLIREDGKVYIAGNFTRIAGVDRYRLARLNADLTLDLKYDPGLGFSTMPVIALQSDGELLAGTDGTVDLVPLTGLVRLNDANPGELEMPTANRIIPSNEETTILDVTRKGGSAGAVLGTISIYDLRSDFHTPITNITVDFADGEFGTKQILLPIDRDPENPGDRTLLARFVAGEAVTETTFLVSHPVSLLDRIFQSPVPGGTNVIRDIELAPDGSVYLAGLFSAAGDYVITNLLRLKPDLTVDTNFRLSEEPNRRIEMITVRPTGEILIGGNISRVGTNLTKFMAQFDPAGILDAPFTAAIARSSALGAPPLQLVTQPDGLLYFLDPSRVRRFTTAGVWDQTNFAVATFVFERFVLLSETNLLGASASELVLDNAITGKRDTNFQVTFVDLRSGGQKAPAQIKSLHLDADQNILVGGSFFEVNSFPSARIARLFPNGIVDTNFVANVGTNSNNLGGNVVTAIQVLPGGDILIGGSFKQVDGKPQAHLARLSSTGQFRENFRPQLQGTAINEFLLLPSGDLLVLGSITNVDGVDVDAVFKLNLPQDLPPVLNITSPTNGTPGATGSFEIKVEAFDRDGFLRDTAVYLDDQLVATSQATTFTINTDPLAAGEHTIYAIATDAMGSKSTNHVTLSVGSAPVQPTIEITRAGETITVHFEGRLQSTVNLVDWIDLDVTSPYAIIEADRKQFYRAKPALP